MRVGYGIDDPNTDDLSAFGVLLPDPVFGQRSLNSVAWANVIWDVSKYLDVGFEVSYRETNYIAPSISNTGCSRITPARSCSGKSRGMASGATTPTRGSNSSATLLPSSLDTSRSSARDIPQPTEPRSVVSTRT